MLEKIVEAMKQHKTTYETAVATYNTTRKQAEAQYNDRLKSQKIAEAYQTQNETIAASQKATLLICESVFDDIKEKAAAVVAKPVSGDFSNVLEAVKQLIHPTKAELEALIGQYKNNYFAYRAINDALGGTEKGYHVATIDDILDACNELAATVKKFIMGTPTGYMYQLLIHPNSTYLSGYDALFTAFIDGRFEEATVIDEQQQETQITAE